MKKAQRFFAAVPALACSLLLLGLARCGDDGSSSSTGLDLATQMAGIWSMAKLQTRHTDSLGTSNGTNNYTEATTEHVFVFSGTQVIAYFVERGNPSEGSTYMGLAEYSIVSGKVFFGVNCVGPVAFQGDTLTMTRELENDGFEKGFYLRYDGLIPPTHWPTDTVHVGSDFGI